MNCTNCGKELERATCENCNTNHKDLLYKLADDSQVRRDYKEAYEYMEILKNSTFDEEELNDINRIMAKLDFAQTDLTGNVLKKEKRKLESLKILRVLFNVLILISLLLIINSIYEHKNTDNKFEIIEVKSIK
jgi:arylamine N-acetyltransferase